MIQDRIECIKKLEEKSKEIEQIAEIIKKSLLSKGKILFCGNGGSASDSNHLACEFISRFQFDRKSLSAISLSANNSIITAIANDYSYDNVFERQLEGLAFENDVLFAISTSGKSKNVINAIKKAKEMNIKTILLTGENKTDLDCDVELNVPSNKTAIIQENHIMIGHIVCEIVENELFKQ